MLRIRLIMMYVMLVCFVQSSVFPNKVYIPVYGWVNENSIKVYDLSNLVFVPRAGWKRLPTEFKACDKSKWVFDYHKGWIKLPTTVENYRVVDRTWFCNDCGTQIGLIPNFDFDPLGGCFPVELVSQSESLRVLCLPSMKLESIPRKIKFLTELRVLCVRGNKLKDLPKETYRLQNLEVLCLGFNPLERLSEKIVGLKRLRYLDLSGTRISVLPAKICNLSDLKTLILPDGYELCCEKLEELFDHLRRISNFDFTCNNTAIRSNDFAKIAEVQRFMSLSQNGCYKYFREFQQHHGIVFTFQ